MAERTPGHRPAEGRPPRGLIRALIAVALVFSVGVVGYEPVS